MQDLYQDQINDESLLNLTIACAVGAISKGSNEQIKNHGLGLLRSEFLFLSSSYEPSEDEMTDCFYKIILPIKRGLQLQQEPLTLLMIRNLYLILD